MRILFVTSSRLAEAVLSCGVLEQLRTTYPKARITVACGASCAGLFSRLPRLERVIVVGKGRGRDLNRFRLWRKLAGSFWDLTVDIRGSNVTRFLLAGQRTIMRDRGPGLRYQQFGAAMGFSPAPLPVTWTVAADHDEAERRLPAGTPWIGFGATASSARKIWPAASFVETYLAIEKILPGCRPVIFAGASDAERVAAYALQASLPGAVLMPDTLTLSVFAAAMSRLRLFIGNDNGLLHLAAASGAPTLGLFGESRAEQYAPAGLHTAAAIAPGPPGKAPMGGLTVDVVLAAAKPLLGLG